MAYATNGQILVGKQSRIFTAVIDAGTGTFKLQALAGNDVDNDTWVDIPDSSQSADTVFSFHLSAGHKYKIVLTGDAKAWI